MPVNAGSLHFLVGPALAVAAVAALGLASRWVFGSERARQRAAAARHGSAGELGLLRPVAGTASAGQANALRAVLSDAGIRSTTAVRRDGRVEVLVFADDLDRARRLVPPGPVEP